MNDVSRSSEPESTGPREPVLRCVDLVRRFGDRVAVNGVSFEIAPGETYGLLGPNGAGKTTVISMIAGVLRADAGTVTVAGEQMSPRAPTAKRAIGLVPQDIALYPDLTAKENLRFFGRLEGLTGRELSGRIASVLEVVGLTDRALERVDTYSGGMKRRLNIAAGLLHEPQLLILDEPTVGVDPQSRNQILTSIEALGGAGLAVLYTTHYMEEAERLCDRVGIIDAGRLVGEGTRRELVAKVGVHDRVIIEATGDLDGFAARCQSLPHVVQAQAAGGRVEVLADGAKGLLAPLLSAAEHDSITVTGVEVREPDLEAVFLHLTGKALRD